MPRTDWPDARVLVTGGAGFIGSHLVAALVQLGASVTVVDDLRTGRLANLYAVAPAIRLIQAELIEALASPALDLAGLDYIFHLAANPYIPPSVADPCMDFRANLESTLALLEALRRLAAPPRLINASSAAVYGEPARLPICEDDPTVPIAPYGVSKLAAERYVAVYSRLYGLPATSLRLFSVFGSRQRKQVVYDFLYKLRCDPARLEILGDGTQARDFVYVGDVVQAMLLTAHCAPGVGEAYNVASGRTYTIGEVARQVCRLCGVTPQIICTGRVRPGDAQAWVVDTSALRGLGFCPQTTLAEGLAAVREWFDAGAP